ncbi:sensor histidine kinase [Actinomadura algeriensis]|uniref:Oxygen sensor histidine kinase NreB n=1 Tax=Actinomadura algeriensis TaxID=1679523 RepID=A0ABR9K3U2_9ACTN|nr:sensor histidine kinase [Actinomadura algeriensis]MBE1537497.1 signal transduction histidine kinase [Actinomadura algeriensis]
MTGDAGAASAPVKYDPWELREQVALGAIPYVLLGISTVLGLLVYPNSPGGIAAMLGLTALGAGWIAWMVTLHPGWRDRANLAVLYYVGLLAILGALIAVNPLYGFAAMVGYVHAFMLPSPWRLAGIGVTAAFSAASQLGGFAVIVDATPVYLLALVVNTAIATTFCLFGWRVEEQSAQRKVVIGELAEANARLEAAMEENAGLQAQLLTQAREAGVQDERQRMAGEIHDTIAQGLAGVVTQLQAARQAHERGADWLRHVDVAQDMARESLAEARRSVHALRPGELEEAALPEALGAIAERWTAAHGVPARFTSTGTVRAMHPEVEGTLLRTAQEALVNVAKHAAASRVALTLSYMGDVVTLDVRDDGVGFAPERVRPGADGGHGLAAMRRRVGRVAGRLEIESAPGAGTALSACVPAVPAEAAP